MSEPLPGPGAQVLVGDGGLATTLEARTWVAASVGPVVAQPNSGEGWDARHDHWTGPVRHAPAAAPGWAAHGARVVGGCCRVGPALLAEVARALRGASPG